VSSKTVHTLDRVVIRFAGDSGDGMQLTGDRFTSDTAAMGNDLSTLPNFPAEIRAPQGTLPGVSSFQLHFADHDVLTPGDAPDVLVAMNPAALKANLGDMPRGATIIVNTDEFTTRNLAKVGYTTNPVDDGTLESFHVHPVALTSITVEALAGFEGLTRKEKERAKNMFALGLLSWMYTRPTTGTEAFLTKKFGSRPEILAANLAALRAGWNYGETTEEFASSFVVAPATMAPGTYRNVTGNTALALGLVAAAHQAGLPLVLGSYPITPASDILHALAALKRHGVTTLQAEDEIAGIGIALGASFGGAIGVTTTSGPGVALKSETIGLAVSLELPLIIVDVQRGGPSTGLPTKTEQADLLQAMFGRNGESPVPIVAPQTPADCFRAAMDAVRIATTYRTPVFLLSDGYLANGSEPWSVPAVEDLPDLHVPFAQEPNGTDAKGEPVFHPFLRDDDTLARPWAVPGTPGLEHRIGGIEKADVTGNISYDPDNHDRMTRLRQAKVDGITVPDLVVDDPDGDARVLVLGWGSTYGPIAAATRVVRNSGRSVARTHLGHLNPFPSNLGEVLRAYDRVVVPEMNLGQLALLLRAEFLVDVRSHTSVRGLPFSTVELADVISTTLEELS
jgi:2-oxoglutarate ferredoxin oxidoreductase subunit alpha